MVNIAGISSFKKANDDIDSLILGKQINHINEVHLSQYMNYFNSLAILSKEGVIEQHIVLQMFKYQLEKTFSFVALIKYMEDFGFDNIKHLLPDTIFTYGTLCEPEARNTILEIKNYAHLLENDALYDLKGYEIVDVTADKVYMGLIPSETDQIVSGRLLKIRGKSRWYNLFSSLDLYEEVEALYDRKIIQLNDTNRYVWVYIKKIQ